ncbi:MAG: Hsp70 family protein [Clostridiales Family XIII bacterium]|jgi:molecular chaperone DnaK|nr:Hsp70 family protein [Clostridiales Family XIII bacterium]
MSRIIGIDLGTSTSEVACVIDGKPVLIPNSLGKAITPSVVHIDEDGKALVGEAAAEYLLTRPDCTFMEVKRMMGGEQVLRARGREYSPEQIQSRILRYLAECAEKYLGETVRRAVITVPAYFTDVQRRATVKTGELAGLTVERILNEPTAAALDYGLENLSQCKNILVYDLGGGTLDITVLELFEGVIDVKAGSGNNRLGGKDFDEALMRHLADPGGDERARMRLKKAAEECKIALSTQESHKISLPFFLTSSKKEPVSVERTVTRADFESLIREKIESTRAPIMSALSDAKLSPADLDIVLLVGGSTRIPCVRRLVADVLTVIPRSPVDPDLTVARGAAVQAAIMDGSLSGDTGLVLTDVCPYTLGAAVLHEGVYGDRLVFDPIIPRNTAIPAEISKIYFPARHYQTSVNISAYQGESSDPENNERLGDVLLTGIPPARRGKEPVEVTFSYDMNGILQMKARSVSTGNKVEVEISTAGVAALSAPDISKWESAPGAKRYRPILRKAEKYMARDTEYGDELAVLVRQIKEALLLERGDRADDLRDELLEILEILKVLEG